jgi:hypothetical protein
MIIEGYGRFVGMLAQTFYELYGEYPLGFTLKEDCTEIWMFIDHPDDAKDLADNWNAVMDLMEVSRKGG